MTKHQVWTDMVGAGRGVLQVAQDVHMTAFGAMCRTRREQRRDVKALRWRLNVWEEGILEDCRTWDECVRKLVEAALEEADRAESMFRDSEEDLQ